MRSSTDLTDSGLRTSGLAAVVLLAAAKRARSGKVRRCEEQVFRSLNERSDHARVPVWAVMQSGSLAAVFVVSGELVRRGRPRTAAATFAAGVAVWGGVKVAKPLIGRGRPAAHLERVRVRGQDQTGLGFPSGHAAVSLTLALIATRDSTPPIRAMAAAVAAVTGGARMYVGAHLPLDVAGGFAIGLMCGRATNAVVRWSTTGP